MKFQLLGTVAAAALLTSTLVFAHSASEMKGMAMGKPTTVTGEVVDMGCYMAHTATGEKHLSCATKCIANGMPMGLLTPNGKLYLVTLDHDDYDPYNKLKDWASKQVTVTGVVSERAGMRSIDASAAQLVAAK